MSLCIAFMICGAMALAQQTNRISTIGSLAGSTASAHAPRVNALRQGLGDCGYVEGRSIVIEYRYAEGDERRLSDRAAELVRLKVDAIVTTGT